MNKTLATGTRVSLHNEAFDFGTVVESLGRGWFVVEVDEGGELEVQRRNLTPVS